MRLPSILLRLWRIVGKEGQSLIQASTLTTLAAFVHIVTSVSFKVYVGRILGPEGFGEVTALLATQMLIGIPAGVIHTSLTRYLPLYTAQGKRAERRKLILQTTQILLVLGSLFAIAGLLLVRPIRDYLQLSSLGNAALVSPLLFLGLMTALCYGIPQGLQRFGVYVGSVFAGGLVKLLGAVLLVWIGWGVAGGILGCIAGAVAGLLISLIVIVPALRRFPDDPPASLPTAEIARYFGPVLLYLLGWSVFTQADLILAKHYFSEKDAGLYALTGELRNVFLTLPATFTVAMFPKVSRLDALKGDPRGLLIMTLLINGMACLTGAILCFLWPDPILWLFGPKFAGAREIVRWFGWAITPVALAYVFINYQLARGRTAFVPVFFLLSCLFLVCLNLFHRSPMQLLSVVGMVGVVVLLQQVVHFSRRSGNGTTGL